MSQPPTPICHALRAEQLLVELDADRGRGLSAVAAHERQQRLGAHALPLAPPRVDEARRGLARRWSWA